jgi:hypothetical protein
MTAMTLSGYGRGSGMREPLKRWARAALAAACLLPGVSWPQGGNRLPATNIDRLAEAADSAAVNFCRRFGLAPGDTIRLSFRADSSDSRGQFVMARWILGLDRRDIRVVRSEDPFSAWSVIPSRAHVRYGSDGRRRFLRSGPFRRTASIELTVNRPVRDGVIRADTLASTCVDEIPRSALESVEQGGLLLGRPIRPREGFRNRILETAAAAAVAGWSAYAFFSIRSH